MNILSWNCRGSGDTTVATLSRYLHCTKAQIAFIAETQCNSRVVRNQIQSLSLCNADVVESEGQSGGLWLLWGSDLSVLVRYKDKNVIVAEVKYQGNDVLFVSVFGDPSREHNPAIWDLIDSHIGDVDQPTCIVEDFNAIVDLEEKSGGSSQLSSQNRRFHEWINGAELIDLRHHGSCFTWTNKRPAAANVFERLDGALGNVAWSLKHPKSAVFHLPRFNSDHMPILVRTEPKPIRNQRGFKTEN